MTVNVDTGVVFQDALANVHHSITLPDQSTDDQGDQPQGRKEYIRAAVTIGPGPEATAKDVTLAVLRELGAKGLLGSAAELYGRAVEALDLAGRITLASMGTEMGGIIALIPPSKEVTAYCRARARQRPLVLQRYIGTEIESMRLWAWYAVSPVRGVW